MCAVLAHAAAAAAAQSIALCVPSPAGAAATQQCRPSIKGGSQHAVKQVMAACGFGCISAVMSGKIFLFCPFGLEQGGDGLACRQLTQPGGA